MSSCRAALCSAPLCTKSERSPRTGLRSSRLYGTKVSGGALKIARMPSGSPVVTRAPSGRREREGISVPLRGARDRAHRIGDEQG